MKYGYSLNLQVATLGLGLTLSLPPRFGSLSEPCVPPLGSFPPCVSPLMASLQRWHVTKLVSYPMLDGSVSISWPKESLWLKLVGYWFSIHPSILFSIPFSILQVVLYPP